MNSRRFLSLAIAVILLVGGTLSVNNLFENLPADEIMIIQSPVSGNLKVLTEPGVYWQGFGKVTAYKKRSQYSFSRNGNDGIDHSLPVTFNDGGHGEISGVVSWEMPMQPDRLIKIHSLFGTQESIEQQLIRPAVERSIYLTGPLMSSTESLSSRRSEFMQIFEDQARYGIYKTETVSQKVSDPVTGQQKTASVVRIVERDGVKVRQSESPLEEFGIVLLPPAIDEVRYDEVVKVQIAEQQKAVAQIQTAQAQAREAEQRAITAAKSGEADAAQAKWKQETLKAEAVVKAEQEKAVAELRAQQELEVARLKALAAEQLKQEQILLGEGEATRKRMIMQADGALEKKLETWLEAQKAYASALQNSQQPLVPSVVMGQSGNGNSGQAQNVQSLLDMIAVRTAKDLALDLRMQTDKSADTGQ